jgi:hypothetical protein
MSHVINGFWRTVDGARDAGVPARPAGKVFEVRPGKVLVALTDDVIKLFGVGTDAPSTKCWIAEKL